MPNRKTDATPSGDPVPETEGTGDPGRAEDVAAAESPLPAPGAESEPAEPPSNEPSRPVETVSVDAVPPEPSFIAKAIETEAKVSREEHHDEVLEDHGEDEPGRSFAARALILLLVLIAGAALGIWAAPRVAPLLPSGLAPVAEWLTPGKNAAEAQIAALQTRVDQDLGSVNARIAEFPGFEDVDTRIKTAVDGAETRIAADVGALQESVSQIDSGDSGQRLARLESTVEGQVAELGTLKQQLSGTAVASGQLSDEAAKKIDVYRAELDGLRAEVGTLQDKVGALGTRIDEVSANADRQIEKAKAQTTEAQTSAETALDAAEAQSEFALMRAAVASGQPFNEPVEKLAARPGVIVPEGLSAAAPTGVATLAALRDSFPDAAHAAIQASIIAGAGEGVLARSKAFIEAQMASRSLTPQAGIGPDAVLSRMEDKLRTDDLKGALAESAQLPSEAQAAMSAWLDAARMRAAAVDGLTALTAAIPATN